MRLQLHHRRKKTVSSVSAPLKLIAMPAALVLFLCHVACAILIGIGSLVTNLFSGLFIFGADIEWIAGAPYL